MAVVFNWDNKKNRWLKKQRNITYEQIIVAIESNAIVDILEHPNKDRYPDQLLILVNINDYIYAVPTTVEKNEFFLKTIYPSRKYTELYLNSKRSRNYER